MARALALLFAAGGMLVLLTLVLPHAGDTDELALALPPLLAFAVAGALTALGPRATIAALQLYLFGGSVLISGCVLVGGGSAALYPILYLLVSSYAFFFFSLRAALVQIIACGALFALVLLLTSDTRFEAATWVMVLGTIAVGGMLVGRLVAAVRAQAADVAAVSQMAGSSDASVALRATCEGVAASLGADVAIMLEPAPDGDGLTVAAMAGSAESGLVFTGERARGALEVAYKQGVTALMETDEAPRGVHRFEGTALGLAQPVLRQGEAVAVLAVAWTSPRRSLPNRARTVALLFAAEASLALDRAEAAAQDRERQALEINDNIVQGLVVAKYSAQRGNVDGAIDAIDDTLVRARKLISDQLAEVLSGRGIRPGDLARAEAAGVEAGLNAPARTPRPGSPR
ncbi:MAG: hypothetical protein JWO90_955 [Solirubrobacterales bacterium]|jgi:signal transduction histidine kinase|nr:hypothetical protein [Solirubrobacterales bacterium]